ncbi:unnamed protein product [Protopolystoma xenopodis]|uniref:Uncharacterized protein n=1 Tax=Protopolystoma xenopodis TaxID=117903 RepID=A0A3S5BBB9_9PLAT|nr:unnamed protein product [Protopolystoma xenopodis]
MLTTPISASRTNPAYIGPVTGLPADLYSRTPYLSLSSSRSFASFGLSPRCTIHSTLSLKVSHDILLLASLYLLIFH